MIEDKKIFSLIDLTSLNEMDNAEMISALCQKARLEHVAAVCIYPQFVKLAVEMLKDSSVKIATVANFPHGTETLTSVITSIQQSLADGAEEIDLVFPYQLYLAGDKNEAYDFISICKKICGDRTLKVILETGLLQEHTAEVSEQVILAGADFLKTSTGKIAIGATLEAARAMLLAIKKSAKPVGFKAAGGIRRLDQVLAYIYLAEEIMGHAWVKPAHFRIGMSRLMVDVESKLC